jgi:hypothetical protein
VLQVVAAGRSSGLPEEPKVSSPPDDQRDASTRLRVRCSALTHPACCHCLSTRDLRPLVFVLYASAPSGSSGYPALIPTARFLETSPPFCWVSSVRLPLPSTHRQRPSLKHHTPSRPATAFLPSPPVYLPACPSFRTPFGPQHIPNLPAVYIQPSCIGISLVCGCTRFLCHLTNARCPPSSRALSSFLAG